MTQSDRNGKHAKREGSAQCCGTEKASVLQAWGEVAVWEGFKVRQKLKLTGQAELTRFVGGDTVVVPGKNKSK